MPVLYRWFIWDQSRQTETENPWRETLHCSKWSPGYSCGNWVGSSKRDTQVLHHAPGTKIFAWVIFLKRMCRTEATNLMEKCCLSIFYCISTVESANVSIDLVICKLEHWSNNRLFIQFVCRQHCATQFWTIQPRGMKSRWSMLHWSSWRLTLSGKSCWDV